MAKPETTFYTSVHRHLPPMSELWREKMANPYRGGTADHWYSGNHADLWVEWKFIVVPKRPDTMIDLVGGARPPLSPLQQSWLRDRAIEGRNVCVIVGSKAGGVAFLDRGWEQPLPAAEFLSRLTTRQGLAQFIVNRTCP